MQLEQNWDKTFPKNENVTHKKVQFKNRYGIILAGDLYQPKSQQAKLPALVISGPFGAVKEQASGLYAQTLAEKGYVTLAFDPSFTGESGGEVRDTASPEINTEDYSAAVDFVGLLAEVDRNSIGALAICGLSGMAITAAASDTRIKAVATVSMYDMSRSMSKSYKDSYTSEQKHKVLAHLSQQRWADAEKGEFARGYHETPFDAEGNIITSDTLFPSSLPSDANPVIKSFYSYYCEPRGFHKRSINSTRAWTATTPMAFFSFPLMENIDLLAQRPVMLIAGENAHSLYYSQDVYNAVNGPKELVIIPGADHVDLYDNKEKIPFDRLNEFFTTHLR
ncbi:TPA: alpha/beta hydrolase [Yersinia enterocolitica]|nr:alpha/beta hydrolase [Yersinia enterocolitica]